jgi:hypothetical protein
MEKLLTDKKIKEMLLKAAKGYKVAEVTVEYAEVDGKMQVMKKKEVKKDVPGDWKALQLLLENERSEEHCDGLSDEELEKEKQRLLQELIKGENHE